MLVNLQWVTSESLVRDLTTTPPSYGLQIWPVHSQGPSEQKAIKNFGPEGAWVYPGAAQSFKVPLIISGTGKAADCKFGR